MSFRGSFGFNKRKLEDIDSSSDEDELQFSEMCAAALSTRRVHRMWISDYIKLREKFGEFRLFNELDDEKFKNYFRVTRNEFDELKFLIGDAITKQNTNFRKCIPVDVKIAICLRFLASGNSFTSLAYSYRLGERTVARIVEETCENIWLLMKDKFLAKPSTQKWKEVAENFECRWQFPNCVGAIDGKHVVIKAPPNSGTSFFNYKKTFSIVLMAVADSNYQFLAVDIGSMGRFSDGGIFRASAFGQQLRSNALGLPCDAPLTVAGTPTPYVFVGDEAFPLQTHLMRPFPRVSLNDSKRIYNFRLSRARRVIENAFGIMSARWRIFLKPIECKVETADKIVKASCILHNFIGQRTGHSFTKKEIIKAIQDRQNQFLPLRNSGFNAAQEAFVVRNRFVDYFNNAGAVSWINNRILNPSVN